MAKRTVNATSYLAQLRTINDSNREPRSDTATTLVFGKTSTRSDEETTGGRAATLLLSKTSTQGNDETTGERAATLMLGAHWQTQL